MQRLLIGLLVVATTTIVPALANAGNQETANQIKQGLESTLSNPDPIDIRVQDGTVLLSGPVRNQEQMNKALKVAYQAPGVTRVVNQMTIGSQPAAPRVEVQPQRQAQMEVQRAEAAYTQPNNPLRRNDNESASAAKPTLAERLHSAFTPGAKSAGADATARAERVPSSFSTRPAAPTSAEEVLAEPQPAPAQKARPLPNGTEQVVTPQARGPMTNGAPLPMYSQASPAGTSPVRYDQPHLPNYAWPTYAPYPNYAAVTYPKQYSPTVWPYIGPFYPYPQVPLGWRKVSLEWSDGWWFLDFKDLPASCWQR